MLAQAILQWIVLSQQNTFLDINNKYKYYKSCLNGFYGFMVGWRSVFKQCLSFS